MLEARVHDSISQISADDWNGCFGEVLEDHAYHLSIERAGLAGFDFFYVTVQDGQTLVGAAAAFVTAYRLETTLDQPRLRAMVEGIRRTAPGFLRTRLAALGSPCTEVAMIGIGDHQRGSDIAALLLDAFIAAARSRGGSLIAIKDFGADDLALWRPLLKRRGFGLAEGQPIARLSVNFATLDAYMAQLSPATRKDMRRKLRNRSQVEMRRVSRLDGFEDAFMTLYRSTLSRAEAALEELTLDFFVDLLARKRDHAFCSLYLKEGELLAANILLHDDNTLLDKYFVMGEHGRRHNLYFVSWFDNVEWCLSRGVGVFQAGQSAYTNKLRLGCQLVATEMAFTHKSAIVSQMLKTASALFASQPSGA